MSEKPLLLSSGKLLVVAEPRWSSWLRGAAVAIGVLMVVIGLADVTSRLASAVAGDHALFDAFAPAAALQTSAVPSATASSSEPLVPARLMVPSLGINAAVEEVARRADGSMGTPKDFLNVGFYTLGPKPGQAGSAVFDGHVNNALTKAGVFEHLSQIHQGDYVTVSDALGRTLAYRVSEVTLYNTHEAPRASIFATTGPQQLVLITCDGEWVQDEHSFNKRLVVVARPAY